MRGRDGLRGLAWGAVLGACLAASARADVAHEVCVNGRDSDGDGLTDCTERATGTAPYRVDTDRDGIPDGVEDANQDGVVDPGESDPRVPGLFAGGYPHIPEPMVFDLVRGLGAHEGEAEVNTIAVVSRGADGQLTLDWAPEVEWAFIDNHAIEFELPMHDRELHALKVAYQATMPPHDESFTHGVQIIGEYLLSEHQVEAAALYLAGGRIRGWSLLGMAGVRASTPGNSGRNYDALVNPSLFYDLSEAVTAGLETNIVLGFGGGERARIIPQLHWQLSQRVRVQLGGGFELSNRRAEPLIASRIILE